MEGLGKILLLLGGLLVLVGLLLVLTPHIPFLGKLPGDIIIKRGDFTFYFPVVTFLLLSLVITIVLNLIFRFWSR